MSALGRLDATLQRLKQPYAVHGTFRQSYSGSSTLYSGNSAMAGGFFNHTYRASRTTEVVWTESALRQIRPEFLPSLDMIRLTAIVDSLGLNPNLTTIWRALPRSFILDWFFPVADMLSQADGFKPSDAWFTNLNTWSSVKATTTGICHERFAPLSSPHTVVELMGGLEYGTIDFSYSTYTRSALKGPLWAPAQVYVANPRIPTKEQWVTLAEMVYQGAFKAFRVKGPSLVNQK